MVERDAELRAVLERLSSAELADGEPERFVPLVRSLLDLDEYCVFADYRAYIEAQEGHTHEPTIQAVSESASYVNLGSWGEDDPPDERTAPRARLGTFLVLRKRADDFFAELMRWDEHLGPLGLAVETSRVLLREQNAVG